LVLFVELLSVIVQGFRNPIASQNAGAKDCNNCGSICYTADP
jgi:hypothetical protein